MTIVLNFSLICAMTRTNIIKPFITTIFTIFLLCVISHSSNYLFSQRKQTYTIVANSSEIAYSSVLLGGFKGVIADILWLRLTDLQSDHKLLELLELSELVTQLEPHIPEVWTFHAWNLSYNISLLATNQEDKWNWVTRGIELLRDKGLEINPNDPTIALELAWIFQHKIGTKGADKNGGYFRTEWVKEISPYLTENGAIPQSTSIMAAELEECFKLDINTMLQIENTFGKIDWRSPYAYSLYWGWIAKKANHKDSVLRSTRMIYTSAAKLALDAGKIIGNPLEENWSYSASPDFSLLDNTHSYIYDCMYLFDAPGIRNMYAGLTWTICNLYFQNNKKQEAEIIYNKLCSSFIDYEFPPLENFVKSQEELEALNYAISEKLISLAPQN